MLIDLSMLVNEATVVFPGDAKPVFEPAGTFENGGFVDHVLHINNHLGTHMDAPGHMLEGGKALPDYPAERFVCDALCIDVRGKRLTAEVLEGSDIRPGMAILLYTGCGDKNTKPTYAENYPPFDASLAQDLIDKGVSMVGVDMISYDHDEPFPIHKLLLGSDILLLENLTNLDKVAGKNFKLYALPMNIELHAAPTRAIAEVS